MADTVKGKIVAIIPKTLSSGKKFWDFMVEGDERTFTSWQETFASKKSGEEIEFTPQKDERGNWRAYIGGARKPYSGGGYRKSPEEILLQKKAFALSYAKDQIGSILAFLKGSVKIPEVPLGDALDHASATAMRFTLKLATQYEAFLNVPLPKQEEKHEEKQDAKQDERMSERFSEEPPWK
jgi:hypothetical protein